jgi:general secretion pathway protein I
MTRWHCVRGASPPLPSRPSRLQGFTLLEVLVALAILGMSLGLLYRASGSGARNVADLEAYQRAVIVGQSLLDLRSTVPAAGWNDAGTDGDYAWRVSSAPFATGLSGPNIPPLHAVEIVVGWGEPRRELVLHTLRPERKPPEPGRMP